eukprot:RCo047567
MSQSEDDIFCPPEVIAIDGPSPPRVPRDGDSIERLAGGSTRRRVCFLPEGVAQASGLRFKQLPHPKSGNLSVFALSRDGSVLEVQSVEKEFGSWFIGDSVEQDGALLVCTPVDPLLMALPTLTEKASDKFRMLVDILEGRMWLKEILPEAQMKLLCDTQQIDDLVVYRLNQRRVLAWLRLKAKGVAACPAFRARYRKALTRAVLPAPNSVTVVPSGTAASSSSSSSCEPASA